MEKQPTILEEMISYTCKLTVLVFMNSGVILLLAYLILDMGSVWIYNGFVDTLTYSLLFAVVLPHLCKYCSLDFIRGWYLRRKIRRNGIPKELSQ